GLGLHHEPERLQRAVRPERVLLRPSLRRSRRLPDARWYIDRLRWSRMCAPGPDIAVAGVRRPLPKPEASCPRTAGRHRGRRVFAWRGFLTNIRHAARVDTGRGTVAARWAQVLTRHRGIAVVGVLAVTLLLAVPMTDMRLGLPSGGNYNEGTDQRASFD